MNETETEQQELSVPDSGSDKDRSLKMASYWKMMLEDLEEAQSTWHTRGDEILGRYRDERNRVNEQGQRRLNLLWTNTQILTPAVYSQLPMVIIERRFLDRDPIGRMSAQILERTTRNELEINGLDATLKRCVNDYLLPGRGQAWVRYEPEFGSSESLAITAINDMVDDVGTPIEGTADDSPEEEKLEDTGEQLIAESVPVDYIPYKDFFIFPARARTWTEVQAVGKRVYLSKEECIEQFGEEIGSEIQEDTSIEHKTRKSTQDPTQVFDRQEKKRVIIEIWNKTDRKVYWISTGYRYLCGEKDDFLKFKHFFPCPEPLSAVMTNTTLVPVPFYIEWQDQALQIDELTMRINMLGKCVKVAGTYDAANRALKRLLDESTENELIPVEDWHRHMEKGGVEGGISFLPIKDVVEALQVLVELRAKIMEDVDRITGISDVLRGTLDNRETMGGTRLKSNNASTRIDHMRQEVARFARDVIALVAEVEAKHFTDKTLIEASGILYEEGISSDDMDFLQSALVDGNNGMPSAAPGGPGAAVPPGLPAGPPPVPQIPPPVSGALPMSGGMGGPPQAAPQALQPAGGAAPQPPRPPMPPPSAEPSPIEKLQRIVKALKLLKKDITRGYRITVETDSTISGDVQEERNGAVQFIAAVTKFLETAQALGGANPQMVPLLGKILQFGVRKFRTGRDLESSIDEFVDHVDKMARSQALNPQPKPPSPEELKIQAIQIQQAGEARNQQLQAQIQEQTAQREAMRQAQNDQRDFQQQQAQDQADMQMKQAEQQAKLHEIALAAQLREREMQMEMEFKTREHAMKMQQLEHQKGESELDKQDRQAEREAKAAERAAKAKTNKSEA